MAKQSKQNTPAPSATQQAAPTTEKPLFAPLQKACDLFMRLPGAARTAICALIVLSIALPSFFFGNSEPHFPFWDENYHMTSGERYIEGLGHLEPHPPLGLLLIAAGEAMVQPNTAINKSILVQDKYLDGNKMPEGFSFAGMRLMPSLFAALGALVFFGLLYSLTENRLIALLFSSLYLFENAYVVHFRAVHLDSFQMFFGIAALWQFVRLWKRPDPLSWLHYAGLGAICGLAIMVKINGVVFLPIFPILYFKDAGTQRHAAIASYFNDFLIKTGTTIVAILLVTYAVFALHLIVGHKLPDPATSAARQDIDNMSPAYKSYLTQGSALTPTVLMSATSDYFKFMDKDHLGVPKLDVCKPGENGSHPMHWLVHDKTINYRWDSADGKTSYVQLTGNQVSWFLGLAALIFSIISIINHRLSGHTVSNPKTYHLIEVFTALYVIFMLLHLYLGTQRVMYMYHYFIGLLFTYVLVVLNWMYLCDLHALKARARTGSAMVIALAICASYFFFLPLNNHWPMDKNTCERRNVFMHIVDCQ